MDYKTRLSTLNLLPLSMTLELNDIIFFLKSVRCPSPSWTMSTSATHLVLVRLKPTSFNTLLHHLLPPATFALIDFHAYGIACLPLTTTSPPRLLYLAWKSTSGLTSLPSLTQMTFVCTTISVCAHFVSIQVQTLFLRGVDNFLESRAKVQLWPWWLVLGDCVYDTVYVFVYCWELLIY